MTKNQWPKPGCGVGLRVPHYDVVLETEPAIDWFEVISENFMDTSGRPIQVLDSVRKNYPIALHGVSLSIGSTDPLNKNYLKKLSALVQRVDPFIVSDHLCWTQVNGENLHDLLPLPFTSEAIEHIVSRVQQTQDFLKRPILIENVSTYFRYKHSEMPEWEFINQIIQKSGCGLLLDLNNIYVNAFNHQFDSYQYIDAIAKDKVGQFHLAGHSDRGEFLFDDHGSEVIDPVWKLYEYALERFGTVATLIEWDENIPPFSQLQQQQQKAADIYKRYSYAAT